MNRVVAFVRLSRPHFLAGGFLMYAIGAAAAPSFDGGRYWLGQLMVTASQITAHYANEYADVEHDRRVVNRTVFSGGSGVLVDGALEPTVALWAAAASTAVTVGAAGLMFGDSGWAAALGLGSLGVSWAYSMPPLRLLGRGVGELAASAVVAGAVPLIGSLAQDASPTPELWRAVAVLIPLHVAMMLAFELPDLMADAASGKRVLAVRIGRSRTAGLIGVLVGAAAVIAATTSPWLIPAAVPAGAMLSSLRAERWSLVTVSAVAMFVTAGLGLLIWLI